MRLFWLLLLLLAGAPAAAACTDGPVAAAAANAASLETLAWAPFRRPEIGWATYATRIGAEIGSGCLAGAPGFAEALARWQEAQKLPATGILDAPTFAAMNSKWTLARPFVRQTRGGVCPEPPSAAELATATADESYGGKTIQLRRDALSAYRRMVAAADRDLPGREARWFRIFSGFRAPIDDDIRCMIDNDCGGVTRATCSAHRTGLAVDIDVGAAPGFGPDSSDDGNRRVMVSTLAYRWLVANADRLRLRQLCVRALALGMDSPGAARQDGAMTVSPLARPFPALPGIAGVRIGTATAGYKPWTRADVLLVAFDPGTVVAGVTTRSRCPSPEVELCRDKLPGGHARGLVVNAGNSQCLYRGRRTRGGRGTGGGGGDAAGLCAGRGVFGLDRGHRRAAAGRQGGGRGDGGACGAGRA